MTDGAQPGFALLCTRIGAWRDRETDSAWASVHRAERDDRYLGHDS